MLKRAVVLPFVLATSLHAQTINVTADATDAPRRIFHAHPTIRSPRGRRDCAYAKWIPGEHGPTGPIADLVNVRITANGQRCRGAAIHATCSSFTFTCRAARARSKPTSRISRRRRAGTSPRARASRRRKARVARRLHAPLPRRQQRKAGAETVHVRRVDRDAERRRALRLAHAFRRASYLARSARADRRHHGWKVTFKTRRTKRSSRAKIARSRRTSSTPRHHRLGQPAATRGSTGDENHRAEWTARFARSDGERVAYNRWCCSSRATRISARTPSTIAAGFAIRISCATRRRKTRSATSWQESTLNERRGEIRELRHFALRSGIGVAVRHLVRRVHVCESCGHRVAHRGG